LVLSSWFAVRGYCPLFGGILNGYFEFGSNITLFEHADWDCSELISLLSNAFNYIAWAFCNNWLNTKLPYTVPLLLLLSLYISFDSNYISKFPSSPNSIAGGGFLLM